MPCKFEIYHMLFEILLFIKVPMRIIGRGMEKKNYFKTSAGFRSAGRNRKSRITKSSFSVVKQNNEGNI